VRSPRSVVPVLDEVSNSTEPNKEDSVESNTSVVDTSPMVDVGRGGTPLSPKRSPRKRRRAIWIGALLLAIIVGGGVTAGIAIQNNHAQELSAAHKAAQHKAAEEAAAKKAAADKKAAVEAAERAQEAADAEERTQRALTVTEVEASVKKMAQEDIKKGAIDGPIIGVSCDPVDGGSTDDLTDLTTAFDCFVANKDNGDGSQNGYFFNATVNWTTGSYTYGFGKSS
jgi:hypothetical protein